MQIGNIKLPDFPLLLAPMEEVTDSPFRILCKSYGADLVFSEFISSEGLIREAMRSKKKMAFLEKERPLGLQIFGGDEEAMGLSSQIVSATSPDLIDINFGCPVKKVVQKGAGAAVIKNCPLMLKLTQQVIRHTHLPVSVKTRLGWHEDSINIMEIAEGLQDIGIQALTIHGRTRTQMYQGEANWEWIAKVKNNPRIHIPIFGNGDITSPEKALAYKNKYAVDGIMIGRAAIGQPWLFRDIKHYFQTGTLLAPPSLKERIAICQKHLILSTEWHGEKTGILRMRRHYAPYFKNIAHMKPIREKLVKSVDLYEIIDLLNAIKEP